MGYVWFTCPQCKRVYLRDEQDLIGCDGCGKVALARIQERFILRCKTCGLTQVQKAFLEMPSRAALKCQNSTCGRPVKAVILSASNSPAKIGDTIAAPVNNKSVSNISAHPSIPQRRSLNSPGIVAMTPSPKKSSSPASTPTAPSNGNISPQVQALASGKPELFNFFGARPLELGKSAGDKGPKNHPGIQPGDIFVLNGENYEILAKLGMGGMGAVHKGQNMNTKAIVAIKEFFYTRYHDPEMGDNKCEHYWEREQKITQIQSESPERCMHYVGSLKITDFQIPEYYIFLEFIEGKPLDKWFTERYKTLQDLTIKELRMFLTRLLMPIARHMHYVHSKGIVHRDLSAQNIMIIEEPDGPVPIIIDWGVAKYVGPEKLYNPRKPYYISSAPEATGIRNRGTPPEVMAGFEPIAATDIYMLGHLMYFLFSGGHYCGTAATNEDFILHPGDLNPDLPADFNRLVESMTAYEPADRMQSMAKVHDAMKWLYENTEILEHPELAKTKFYLYCDYNEGLVPLPEKQVIRLGRDEIIGVGQKHDYDGHLYEALLPCEGDQFQFEFFLDGGYAYIRDLHSKMGTIINNLTMTNQQTYQNVAIKGMNNCYIPLSETNLNHTTIEVPFVAPDGITYHILFKIVQKM